MPTPSAEATRLDHDRRGLAPWRRWGPYLSDRAWGTVREDYSPHGDAWDYLPHDHARSRAFRWGEDGLTGISDRYQLLAFALALWNGRDPILKERLFGLVPREGNHGEDVKEYYFYLDSTPTHSYLKFLYKYPHVAFPYVPLIDGNLHRSRAYPEFELLDTGVFADGRYFDVVVEYAKAGPEDLAIRIEAHNRGPDDAPLHVLPHLWFRNTWAWDATPGPQPVIRPGPTGPAWVSLMADDSARGPVPGVLVEYRLGSYYLHGPAGGRLLFTDNETNLTRLHGVPNRSAHVKDAFHRHVIHGEPTVNPALAGTKACFHFGDLRVPAGGAVVLRLRLTNRPVDDPLADIDAIVADRRREADEFYATVHPPNASVEERQIQRQALAGMLWSKQVYLFDVRMWLDGDDPAHPPPASRQTIRNARWRHLNSMRILSMPDKWEYPWFAAWDLALHTVPLALVDPAFAKEQLWLLLFEQFQHANGQVPAYEWEFSDLNPPIQAWAAFRVYDLERTKTGNADRLFLEKCFHKLLLNFAWWVNRVDADGHNVFEGGFLGLDNIAVLDRSAPLPPGVVLKQSDATGWMGMYCLNLMRIALELARENPAYEVLATKFFEHYVYIGSALQRRGEAGYELWSQTDGFFYDVLRYPDGSYHKFRVRSLVGLIPLYAVERLDEADLEPFPDFRANFHWFLTNRPQLAQSCVTTRTRDGRQTHVLALAAEDQLRRLLARVWDPAEFLSPHGLRSLSKHHEAHPFVFGGAEVRYEPAEAVTPLKGGNSNWRGPVWFPTTALLIDSLRTLGDAYGPGFAVAGVTPGEMARGLARRLVSLFERGADGRRPADGRHREFADDPHWRDLLLFYEYFHGDTGAGLGASHQTGWTGLVATLIDEWPR